MQRVKRNSRTSYLYCNSLSICKSKNYTTYVLRRSLFEIHFTVKSDNTLLSSDICHDDKARCSVIWRRRVHSRTSLSWMIMEYTYDEYGDVPVAPVPVIVGLVLRKGNTHYIFLVTSSSLDCASTIEAMSSWDMKFNTYDTCECGSPTECTDTSQWGCHNCSCGTRAV